MRRAAWLFALMVGCAEDEGGLEYLEPMEHRFTHRPVHLIVSSALPAPCFPAIDYCILWYREHGVTMTREVADYAQVLRGIPTAGQVGIVPDQLAPNVRGETYLALTANENILGAEIHLAACDPQTIAHELGHALGLTHTAGAPNLMHRAINGGEWVLTDEQLDWIRD